MTLDIDKEKLMIMGVQFDSPKEFRIVWNAISTNMIEGWRPTGADVEALKKEMVSLRGATSRD